MVEILKESASLLRIEFWRNKVLYTVSWVGGITSAEASPSHDLIFGVSQIHWQHAAIVGGVLSAFLLCVKTTLEILKMIREKKPNNRGKK